jgi:long-chain acyl-CoA synthetase
MPSPQPLFKGLVSGAQQVSQAGFELRALKAAAGFAALGLKQGDCVAILMRNDIPFLEASLAAVRLGAYAVPINWHFKPDEVGYILQDCGARVLVAHRDLLEEVAGVLPPGLRILAVETPDEVRCAYGIAPSPHQVMAPGWSQWLGAYEPWQGAPAPQLSSMIYTSGTTGRPKGVRRDPFPASSEATVASYRARVYGLVPGVRTLMPGPLYHSAPNAFAMRAARLADVLILMPRFDPEEFLALVDRQRIDTLFMVPTMFVRLLKLPSDVRARYDLSCLKFVMHAAAPCPPDVKAAMIAWWGPVLHEFYGSTESGAVTVVDSHDWLARRGTVGRAIEGGEIRILAEDGTLLGPGQVGEVYTRLSFYPDFTYHGLPDKRREIERDGFITSGDVGYLDGDGFLFLCDRRRDMVISGGVNIYPAEIESVLVTCPGVRDCAVFGIPHAEYGEQLMAVVEMEPGVALDMPGVIAFLSQRLAGYKVPRLIEARSDLPREDSGKIFKRRLRAPYWQAAGRTI